MAVTFGLLLLFTFASNKTSVLQGKVGLEFYRCLRLDKSMNCILSKIVCIKKSCRDFVVVLQKPVSGTVFICGRMLSVANIIYMKT